MGKKNSSGRKLRKQLRQWFVQRDEAVEVELPSGLVLLSRKPDMLDFVLSGEVPQTFFGSMMALFNRTNANFDLSSLSLDTFTGLIDLCDRMMLQCVVEPLLVTDSPTRIAEDDEDETPDQINVRDIGGNDKMAYFSWSTGDIEAMKSFRTGQQAVADQPAPDGEGVRSETE